MSDSRTIANSGMLANVLSGETHVLYGAVALAGAGAVVLALGWASSNSTLAVLGILILVVATGILVDVWAHQFNH